MTDLSISFLQEAWKQEIFQFGLSTVVIIVMLLIILFLLPSKPKPFLNPEVFKQSVLKSKHQLTHNTIQYVFELEFEDQRLGLPIGQHIILQLAGEQGLVKKKYTPVTTQDTEGVVKFVIKLYENGAMSQCLKKLDIGDCILMKGPKGKFQYKRNMKRHIGMVAGGTGITPMYQIMQAILSDPKDKTELTLIYGNVTVDDIILKKELDTLASEHVEQLHIHYVLDKPPTGWHGGSGYITKDVLSNHLPDPSSDVMICRCGPPLMNKAVEQSLRELGYAADSLFQF